MSDSIPNGYSDGDVDTNRSTQPSLEQLAADRYSRRQTLLGGLGATAFALFGTSLLAACGDDNESPVVAAGSDGSTSSGRMVTLTGSASDNDGSIASSTWTQTAGPTVDLIAAGTNAIKFLAPSVSASTVLTFKFTAKDDDGAENAATTNITVAPAQLGFTEVGHSLADVVTVPSGYSVTVMTRLGDPLASGVGAYANDGTDSGFDKRIGDHGDALAWFGLDSGGGRDDSSSTRGLVTQNHENITQAYLHVNGPTSSGGVRPFDEVLKEIECHGVSVTEYKDSGERTWSYVQTSSFNRRITPNTATTFRGPAAGSSLLVTPYSSNGTAGRGCINNCANGHTGWATLLTCEENWAGYFKRTGDDANRTAKELTALTRYGVTTSGNYSWTTASTSDTRITRWDARATAGGSATTDWRNEPNQFGWVVEIDPYDPASTPRKRTALGRMGHEGAWLGRLTAGKKPAVYMGDDSRREYLYKFVSSTAWDAADASAGSRLAVGDKYLDAGTLYVAVFNADGSGTWKPLVFGTVPNLSTYTFADQADILVNTRLAADAVGATPMDRPEWTAVNPVSGEVYLTLTNNNAAGRPLNGTDAANPRHYGEPTLSGAISYGNPTGHIIRLREDGDDHAATTFTWDIYLFGADSTDASPMNVNLSGLTTKNDFSSPDGLWFSRTTNAAGKVKPVLWIETDDGQMTDRTNCMMLAAMPGSVGDGGAKTITNIGTSGTAQQKTYVGAQATAASLRRFLVGPVQCEITGVDTTPDGRTIFVGIQHPGESGSASAPSSHWPSSQTEASPAAAVRPRSAIVAITKDDGGVIAL